MNKIIQVETDGARLAVEHAGTGPAVVFLHAGVGDRRMWAAQLAELADAYHVVAFDMRGFGDTAAADVPFSRAGDLRAVLDTLRIDEAILVGCSQGGRVAVDFTLAYPGRARGLVLIAPAVSGAPPVESYPPALAERIAALDEADEMGDLSRVNELEAWFWLDGPFAAEGRVGGAARQLFLDMNSRALAHPPLTQEEQPEAAYGRLEQLDLPVLVVWGDLDFPHITERCREIVWRIPGARGEVIAGAAHMPSLEQPDKVNKLLRAFVEEEGLGFDRY